jgi:uncharacterized membrane protein YhaH (DUF805 family)
MTFFESIKAFWLNYANFKGRTSRTTFWWTVLFLVLAGSLVGILFPGQLEVNQVGDWELPSRQDSIAQNVWSLAVLLPSLALGVRRLQDIGKPGQYLWFILVPIAGAIMLLIWFLKPGETVANKDGEPVR